MSLDRDRARDIASFGEIYNRDDLGRRMFHARDRRRAATRLRNDDELNAVAAGDRGDAASS